jgi:hypothetical protein
MAFVITDKIVRRALIGFIIVVVLFFIVYRYRSSYKYPDSTDTSADYTKFSSNLQSCQDAFQVSGDATVKDACYSSNVSSYVQKLCPNINGLAPTDATTLAYWNTYTGNSTSDVKQITNKYVPFVNTPTSVTVTGTPVTTAMILAARKADMTGATRKYLASSCPNFYVSGDGLTNPTTTYSAWAIGNATNGFVAANVTATKIADWLMNAAVIDSSGNATGPLVTGSTSWNKQDVAGAAGTPNWKKARDAGPGTMPYPTWGTVAA